MVKKYNVIDLFAGCGGLMEGFENEGSFRTIACVEWESAPCETLVERLKNRYKHKHADSEVVRFDIQRTKELFAGYDDPEYGKNKGLDSLIKHRNVDIIIGGPPCQAYSLAGRIRDKDGMKNDYRNYLFESYVKVVSHYKPKFFVFENVQGMLSAAPDGELITSKITKAFQNIGYRITSDFKNALFDVADFGIPQHRKRIIILGVREALFSVDICESILEEFYTKLMPAYKSKQTTVKEAIGDLPALYPLDEVVRSEGKRYSHSPIETNVSNHIPRFHNERDIKVFKMLAEDIKSGKNEYAGIDKLRELYTEVTGRESNIHKFYVLRSDEPSNTIPAHLYKDGLRHIHPDPEQARSITVREAARLQTFPDDFFFLGGMTSQYKMIGNAVPPMFAGIVAKCLKCIIKKYQ